MDCVFGSPITDDDISSLIDNRASDELVKHIENCASCRQRYQEAKEIERNLVNVLYRGDCPTPLILADYQMGLVDDAEARWITAHLEICSSCREELRLHSEFLADDVDVVHDESITGDVSIRVPNTEFRANASQAEFAVVRGSIKQSRVTEEKLTVRFGNSQILLDVQKRADGYSLSGTILTQGGADEWSRPYVELQSDGKKTHMAFVDELDQFTFFKVPSGQVTLTLVSRAGTVGVIENIVIPTD